MLLLTTTSEVVQVITAPAANIDVHASFVDTASGVITPGRADTPITTAATTQVVAAPPASTQRNVKTLHIRNKDGAVTCTVTVQIFDGGAAFTLFRTALKPQEMLQMVDMGGFSAART